MSIKQRPRRNAEFGRNLSSCCGIIAETDAFRLSRLLTTLPILDHAANNASNLSISNDSNILIFPLYSLLAYDDHASTNENRQDIHFVGTADNDDATDPLEFIEVTPHQQTVSEGEEVTFECQPRNIRHRVHIEWRRLHGRLPSKAIIRRGRLTIPNVHMEDAGVYICKVSSIFIPKEAEVHLNVHSRNGGLREQTGPSRCLEGKQPARMENA
ncbi:Basement membrane-specific heparan sulfate proteoglycan core protein [Trichinella spiralis]|uniref:Basement membrane-specific heparan sulfate proteoglycan core protein n=1 Tax=Trichinella spiralis TaxID=6334 RepID=A0ABR3L172_TRISP